MSLNAERPIHDVDEDISERTRCRQEALLRQAAQSLDPNREIFLAQDLSLLFNLDSKDCVMFIAK